MKKFLVLVILFSLFFFSCGNESTENKNIDKCENISCNNHGNCVVLNGSPSCACDKGYHADKLNCILDTSQVNCELDSCLESNKNICTVVDNEITCSCNTGYFLNTDNICEEEVNNCDNCKTWEECIEGLCTLKENRCNNDQDCSKVNEACNLNTNTCEEGLTSCDNVTCNNKGTCILNNDGFATCECDAGFYADKLDCFVDHCIDVNCGEGTCINNRGVDSYCECNDTYKTYGKYCVKEDAPTFITTWITDSNKQVRTPVHNDTSHYSYSVDCDSDGEFEEVALRTEYTCQYEETGTYKLTIVGEFPRIFNTKNLQTVEKWGTQKWVSMAYAFHDCLNLEIKNSAGRPDLSNVIDMSHMFEGAKNFNSYIGAWDVSTVKDMSYMFKGAINYMQVIKDWNVSNVTDMSYMFNGALRFNQLLEDWNVTNVKNMSHMFDYAIEFNQSIKDWDVSNVTNMSYMFFNASSFDQNLASWPVDNVTECESFSLRAESWRELYKPSFTSCSSN